MARRSCKSDQPDALPSPVEPAPAPSSEPDHRCMRCGKGSDDVFFRQGDEGPVRFLDASQLPSLDRA
jgi:hypothetical protein